MSPASPVSSSIAPAQDAAPALLEDDVDARAPVERLTEPDLRQHLLAYALSRGVPSRHAEDTVQQTLLEAWAKRDDWPRTPRAFKHYVFAIAYCNAIDEHRVVQREPLLEDDPGPAAPAATPIEVREGLASVEAYVEGSASMKRALGYVLRWYRGDSYAEIAAADGVTEQAVKSSVNAFRDKLRAGLGAVLAAHAVLFVLALTIASSVALVADRGARPHPVAASAPDDPRERAARLRRRAYDACDARDWAACLERLDDAAAIDPPGDDDPRVRAARALAGGAPPMR
jgi:DNA-directed RNA polymerase specialized sigma24 family protein